MWGQSVDAIDYYTEEIEKTSEKVRMIHKFKMIKYLNDLLLRRSFYSFSFCNGMQEAVEREKVMADPKAIIPAAFVSFKSRWGAVVCAQTQQTRNPTIWLTEWAPEPRDIYWKNLAIPYVELAVKKLLTAVALFFLTFFFMIPIAIVQSIASIDGIEKVLPFLKPLIEA